MTNFNQPIKQENIKTPENKSKEGVDFVFEQHPELSSIGTKKQYSEYIETIYPESKIRDISYHGSKNENIEKFLTPKDENFKRNKAIGSVTKDHGIYFSKSKKVVKYFGKNTYPVVLNIKNIYKLNATNTAFTNKAVPAIFGKKIANILGISENPLNIDAVRITDHMYETLRENNVDGIGFNNNYEIIVFEPEQIHILGSKKDIEEFKNFISKTQEK